jgi:hypothetical protein
MYSSDAGPRVVSTSRGEIDCAAAGAASAVPAAAMIAMQYERII